MMPELALPRVTKPSTPPLALYVHWPFCVSKCPYCDFNSHVRETIDQESWRNALLLDLAHEANALPERTLGSIFFGGGTPSLMPPATVEAIIAAATGHWSAAPDLEITLEANPSSVETARFADLAASGVHRVSLGLQALDDDALRFLGRAHDVQEGLAALDVAQRHFSRVNVDLIYALPGQQPDRWARDLDRVIALGTDHLSLYQLTIEPGTRFETMVARGDLSPIDSDQAASLFELTQTRTVAAGLPAYEVSNHARPGSESRHNLTYWRYTDYAGIGPGAHGRRGGLATERHRKPENWLAAVARNAHGMRAEDALQPAECAREALVMGLRLVEGVDLFRVARLAGRQVEDVVDHYRIALLEAQGLLRVEDGWLRVLPPGMLLLDAILREVVTI